MNESVVTKEIRVALDDAKRMVAAVDDATGRASTHVEIPFSVLEEWERKLEERDHRAASIDPFEAIAGAIWDEISEEGEAVHYGCDEADNEGCGFKHFLKDRRAFAGVIEKTASHPDVAWAIDEAARQIREKRI